MYSFYPHHFYDFEPLRDGYFHKTDQNTSHNFRCCVIDKNQIKLKLFLIPTDTVLQQRLWVKNYIAKYSNLYF